MSMYSDGYGLADRNGHSGQIQVSFIAEIVTGSDRQLNKEGVHSMRYGMSVRRTVVVAGLLIGVIGSTVVQAKDVPVKSGQKIAFMGDSITQGGANGPKGYVNMVISGLAANNIKAECIPAGISGHKSNDMLARLNNDVISKKPDWMTLSCGVNDVWHGANGVPLDKYMENITKIVEQCRDAKIKVVILTSTMIGEDEPNANNQKLMAYNDFLKTVSYTHLTLPTNREV